jgi:hypothetical protein
MAYGELYRFVLDAANGPEVTISVAKKDYTGAVSSRAVGGSAVLKRERSGHILGSSLEWAAECLVEDEFADLYTSDPTLYQVTVKFGASRIWRGFITPELYFAPWVNAPYDITLTASDNLAELKNYDFQKQGDKTVRELLLLLLDKTNQDVASMTAISSLVDGDERGLLDFTINIDQLEGSTCYEVLDKILESFHAYIRFDAVSLRWVLLRETDVSNYSGISYIGLSSLAGLGQLFPVGNLSMNIEPAKKGLSLILDHANPRECLPAISSASSWFTSSGATIGSDNLGNYIGFPGGSKDEAAYVQLSAATLGLNDSYSQANYTLQLNAYMPSGRYVYAVISILVSTSVDGSFPVTLYLYDTGTWHNTSPVSNTIVNAPKFTFDEINGTGSISFKLPQKEDGTVPYMKLVNMRVELVNCAKSTCHLYDVSLRRAAGDLPDGIVTRILLDNEARGRADDVTLSFGADRNYENIINAKDFTSAAISEAKTFNDFMAIDNALSIANPRLRLSGLVMYKSKAWKLPEFIRTMHSSAANLDYIVEQYTFNLVNGEIDISMLSLPAVSLSYTELTTSNVYGQSSGGSGGSSSGPGGSGGSGAPGAAAGFDTPEATATAVDGTTPTAKVTASGPDTAKKFSFVFGIPKASDVFDSQARLRVRPVLKVFRRYTPEEVEINSLSVKHPALSSDKYEAVLMVYRRLNKRKTGISQAIGGGTLRMGRKGWFVALGDKGVTDHAAFTVQGFGSGQGVIMRLAELRDFIVKRFMEDSAHTKAELWGRNYIQWAAESNARRGFGSAYKTRKKFGIAVRYVNPAFTALVDQTKPLSPTTMELTNTAGEKVPRYIYSDVAPLTVELQNKGAAQRASMWFGVSG